MLTGAVQEISHDGVDAELSPDGSRIALVDGRYGSIEIAGSQGESPRTFFRPPPGDLVGSVHWVPGGNRIGYLIGKVGDVEIQTRNLDGGDPKRIVRADTLTAVFAPRGRVYYTTKDTQPQGVTLWTVTIDPGTGEPTDQPARLATWPGVDAAHPLTISADGTRLAVTKQSAQSDVYQLTLDSTGNAVTASRQLTTDTQVDWPSQWTADGSAFLFYSNRHGAMHAFRQSLASEDPQAVVAGSANIRAPQLTADGASIVYLEMTSAPEAARIMRVPKDGGPAQEVLRISSRLATARMDFFVAQPGTTGTGAHTLPDLRCPPRAADGSCLLLEARPGAAHGDVRMVLVRVDPATGRTKDLATIGTSDETGVFWDVSPDGSTVAFGQFDWSGGDRITLLRTATGEQSVIQPKGVKNLCDIAWAPDGRSLFAVTDTIRAAAVLHVGLDGSARTLRSYNEQVVMNPRPSPDGRSLLVGVQQTSSNVWIIER